MIEFWTERAVQQPGIERIVLEPRVAERVREYADAQSVSVSVIVNKVLKDKLGITREEELV